MYFFNLVLRVDRKALATPLVLAMLRRYRFVVMEPTQCEFSLAHSFQEEDGHPNLCSLTENLF